nr:reverse transcriptase/maturase family protein [Methylobacterium sp. OTU13CASTA1]
MIEDNGRFSKSETVRSEIENFRDRATLKLRSLSDKLRRGTFRFPPARAVPIPKGDKKDRGNFRPIVLATVEARIVQRSILGVLTGIPELQPFFRNPNSFGGIRKAEGQELAAVPAAIQEVLAAIGKGAAYAACADINGFFTRIPKSTVTDIIGTVVRDAEFMSLFSDAVKVELSNMAEMRERAERFPIHDIGVAQGNSLSPLLGNVILHEFDTVMNEGDCRCIRYIDDFIVLGPTRKAVAARMRLARKHLGALGMTLSEEKTHAEPQGVADGFEFLGIELTNGLIRPTVKAQRRLLKSLDEMIKESASSFRALRKGTSLPKSQSFLGTLRRVDGAIQGWGRHYWFCNDRATFAQLDAEIDGKIRGFIGIYADERKSSRVVDHRCLLGIDSLVDDRRAPFAWPESRAARRTKILVDLRPAAFQEDGKGLPVASKVSARTVAAPLDANPTSHESRQAPVP